MKFYHATTPENAISIMWDGVIKSRYGEVFLCKKPSDACKFLAIRGCSKVIVIEVELPEDAVIESYDHSESFFQCKAYIHNGDIKLTGAEVYTEYTFDFSRRA